VARIIVVDDDPGVAAFLVRCLDAMGHETRAVATGKAALELLASWAPDLLITDINMPDMDGIELLRSVQKRSAIPVIAISGGGLIPVEVLLRNAELLGAVHTIAKPFQLDDIRDAVSRALSDRPLRDTNPSE
jgi:CheY-like chemotaxis protein